MIYITGDTHGELDRFKGKELRRLGKNDILFVLGDFGFLWDGSKEEQARLKWLCKRPYTILFLDGTHENYDLLDPYPVEEKFGGRSSPSAGMSITSAGGVFWSWKGRAICALAEERARTRRTGSPASTGGPGRCPRMRNTPTAKPMWRPTITR